MSFHVPFEHRRGPQPIYIGFEMPPRPKRIWNWWAFFGFPLSLLGILTAGILAPVALLFNAIAMRHRPRRLATAGLTLSLIGTALLATLAFAATHHARYERHQREHRQLIRENKNKAADTRALLASVSKEFESYRKVHDGRLPNWIDANMVTTSYEDAWQTPLRFDAEDTYAVLRSAGADKLFDTNDDITLKIEGTSPRTVDSSIAASPNQVERSIVGGGEISQ
ncbi:MAG TPA: hypothetical protein PKD54_10725 [Pirellulaceae bacterium]|nr:hypothetical protein [Pirellulaceae bacterium]